jgi:hypothetical protein
MSKLEVGQVFGRITVMEKIKGYRARCVCVCGNEKIVSISNVISGRTVSCGCRMRETCGQSSGLPTETPTHNSWENMHNRCNPKSIQHINSGTSYVGVTVCDRWKGPEGFRNFVEDMGKRPENKTLDRLKNNKGYSPENCRWATKKEQQNNRRGSVKFHFRGKLLSISDIMELTGLTYMKVWHDLKRGILA